jgi:hypothetical protein
MAPSPSNCVPIRQVGQVGQAALARRETRHGWQVVRLGFKKSPQKELPVGELLQPWHLLVIAFIFFVPMTILVGIIPYWVIFKKAGFSPFLSLLMLLPVVGIVVLFVVAFSDWKVVPAPQFGWGPPPPYPQYPPEPPQA